MKRQILTAGIIMTLIAVACHKDPVRQPDPSPIPPSLKLKDVTLRNLPSPYYHFEYDNSGKIINLNYQSGLRVYDVNYNGQDIASMQNSVDPARGLKLEYVYFNGDFVGIKVKNINGEVLENCIVSYNSSHQLQEIEWDVSDGSTGFLIEQTLTYRYYPDGNVKEIVTHNYPVGSQTEAIYTDTFENYDDHVNADGFSLANNSTHEPILLTGTTIQLNNPRRLIRTGDGVNYEINYNYNYDSKGRPSIKTGDVKFTSGPNAGQHFESQSTFSYYD